MSTRRVLRVLVLTLVVVLSLTLPLVGCTPKAPPQADPPGDTGDGGTGGGTPGGPPDTGDATPGRTLGDWTGAWAMGDFKAGQHFRYEVDMASDGEITKGWYSLTFSDGGSGKLKVEYAGNIGLDFSGSFTTSSDDVNIGDGMDFMASMLVLPLLLNPFAFFFSINEWDIGTSWSIGDGEDAISFQITGKRTYAGVEGVVGEFRAGGEATSIYVINPYVPLVLYCKFVTDDKNYVEYKLVELGGF